MAHDMVVGDNGQPDQQQLLEQLLENQKQDFALRAQQLELDKQKDNNALAFGREALAAQERDRIHDREVGRKTKRDVLWLIVVVAIIIGAIITIALCMGKDTIASEIIKAVAYGGLGSAGGYGLGRSGKTRQDQPSQSAE